MINLFIHNRTIHCAAMYVKREETIAPKTASLAIDQLIHRGVCVQQAVALHVAKHR